MLALIISFQLLGCILCIILKVAWRWKEAGRLVLLQSLIDIRTPDYAQFSVWIPPTNWSRRATVSTTHSSSSTFFPSFKKSASLKSEEKRHHEIHSVWKITKKSYFLASEGLFEAEIMILWMFEFSRQKYHTIPKLNILSKNSWHK